MISKEFNGQCIYVPWIVHVKSIGSHGSCVQALLDCLMYKLSYYRYAEAATMTTGQYGFDRVRNVVIGRPDIELEYFEEVSLRLGRLLHAHLILQITIILTDALWIIHSHKLYLLTDRTSGMMSWMHVMYLHLHRIRQGGQYALCESICPTKKSHARSLQVFTSEHWMVRIYKLLDT